MRQVGEASEEVQRSVGLLTARLYATMQLRVLQGSDRENAIEQVKMLVQSGTLRVWVGATFELPALVVLRSAATLVFGDEATRLRPYLHVLPPELEEFQPLLELFGVSFTPKA